ARLANDFFAFGGPDAVTLRDGAYVAAGDLDGDGRAELVFGAGPGGAPRVVVIDPATGVAPVATFFTLGDTESRAGAPVTVDDRDGDGRPEVYAMNPARGLVCVYRDPSTLAAAGTPYDQVYVPLPRPVEIPPVPLVS
ncbi:MAG: hypothetical protein K2P78_05650, partial [Gemmataceae bacterium]|nr:hypothetical protein [Gemmataceae bacterium]